MNLPRFSAEASLGPSRCTYYGKYLFSRHSGAHNGMPASIQAARLDADGDNIGKGANLEYVLFTDEFETEFPFDSAEGVESRIDEGEMGLVEDAGMGDMGEGGEGELIEGL